MSYTIILPTVYGNMLVNRFDGNQTTQLLTTGHAIDFPEIDIVKQFIEPGTNAVDIGTCFGCWTLAFSKKAAKVYSFEAQRIVYNQLCGSLALNAIENVFAYNVAVGSKSGILDVPKYSYYAPLEFGCVYFCPRTVQGEMKQEVQPSTETVNLVTLDSYNLTNVSVIKIDVEGMEVDVLEGAKKTIETNRPVLCVEMFMVAREIFETLSAQNYIFLDNQSNTIALPAEKFAIETAEDKSVTIKKL